MTAELPITEHPVYTQNLQKLAEAEADESLRQFATQEVPIYRCARNIFAVAPIIGIGFSFAVSAADNLPQTHDMLAQDATIATIFGLISGAFEVSRRVAIRNARAKNRSSKND